MTKNKLFEKLPNIAMTVYIIVIFSFLLRIVVDLIVPAKLLTESPVPALSSSSLNKVSELIGKREKLPVQEKIDLSKFNFGKPEPF